MSKKQRRTKWTEEMNKDVLECKERAQELISSENPPLSQNGGRKKGYIQLMKELWDDKGYGNLSLTGQNLRDQASRLQKLQVCCTDNLSRNENEENDPNNYNEAQNATSQPRPTPYLHTSPSQSPEELIDKEDTISHKIQPNLPEFDVLPNQIKDKKWGEISYEHFFNDINETYDEIVHFRRNIFNIPSGKAGKDFITELTFWLRQFNCNTDLNSIALKAFMVLPTLILQKPSASSKTKEHSAAIERRLLLWKEGNISILMKEIRFIQGRFKTTKKPRTVEDVSKVFARLVMQGKLTAAIKLLDRESSSGLLTPSPEVLEELTLKHPPGAEIENECLLHGPIDYITPSIFDSIDEQLIFDSTMKTRGSAGPSGMDAQLYRRILCSKSFNNEGKLLRQEIATMTRNVLKLSYHPSLLEGYTSCRLIPLDKNPGIRPIGIGEVLRRIVGKTVSAFFKEEIKEAAGPLQVCAGYTAGAEAAIHAMNEVFIEEETDGILLIDASNAFNVMNRSVAMHNTQIMCKEISLYLINTYRCPSRLFITGGGEISSQEGTTQGDPLAMPWYSINTTIMINILRTHLPDVKQVWFADDAAGAGRIQTLHDWYKILSKEGIKYGYHVNGSKSWLILKTQELSSEAELVFGDEVNITAEGKRHLGAVIGTKTYKDEYCNGKVNQWREELEHLSEIAKSQPHAAYTAFTKAYKSKFTFCMRTIESFEDYTDPIHEVINEIFIPTLFGQVEPLADPLQELITLTPTQGGLGIPLLKEEAPQQFAASKKITALHKQSIIEQKLSPLECSEDLKKQQQSLKAAIKRSKAERIDAKLSPDLLPYVNQARDKGASSWLNALPLQDQGLALNKQEFRDSLRLRYNLALPDLPSHCTCGSVFSVNHALSCKKGGFVAQRHDGVRDLLTTLLNRVCNNVQAEPHLIPLDNEHLNLKSSNTSPDARLDIKAGGFWSNGVTAFFDVRVTHVNSASNQNKSTSRMFKEQEQEKKRKYQQRVLNVEMGTFTPLIFGTNGGMGTESQLFLRNLANLLAKKSGEDYASVITWIRTILNFNILRTVHLCIRGSRTPFRNNKNILEDFRLNNHEANIL